MTRHFRAFASRPPRSIESSPCAAGPADRLRRILIVTDAWLPQVNGVVRSIEALLQEAPALGVAIEVLDSTGFRTAPIPTYPSMRFAVTRPAAVARRIEAADPDFVHIATEGPLGLCAWIACRRAGRPFTTCYHTRFPEYLAMRHVAPRRLIYWLLRRFHNAGLGVMVATQSLERELRARGFNRLMRWTRGSRRRAVPAERALRLQFSAADLSNLRAPGGRKEPRGVSLARFAGLEGRRRRRTGSRPVGGALSRRQFPRRIAREGAR